MSTPCRVLQIVGKVNGGGVSAVVMEYYRHINREEFQFDFVIDGYEKTFIENEVLGFDGKIFHVQSYKKNIFTTLCELYAIIKNNTYQCVHCHMNTMSVFFLFVAWLAGARIRILHNHTTTSRQEGKRWLLKQLLRPCAPLFATHKAACSQYAAEWMYGKARVQTGKVTIIPNLVAFDTFCYNEAARNEIRERLAWKEDAFVVGHVGRFACQKNHRFLLAIFAELCRLKPEARLLLVGDGELRPEVEQQAAQLGLTDRIHFAGVRQNPAPFYQAMDCFVLPSLYEGLSIAALEAQAAGLPVFAADNMDPDVACLPSTVFLSLHASARQWAKAVASPCVRESHPETWLLRKGHLFSQHENAFGKLYRQILQVPA